MISNNFFVSLKETLLMGFVFLMCFIPSHSLIAQSHADCISAFSICELKTYHVPAFTGYGNLNFELSQTDCLPSQFKETNSYWIKWKAATEGIITFTINPINDNDDIDFVLAKRLDGSCSNLEPMRCMVSGSNHGSSIVNNNCLGATGLSINSVDDFEKSGCDFNSDNYLKFLSVNKGEEYLLMINNYNSNEGFSISFEGTASLKTYDDCSSTSQSISISDVFPNPVDDVLNIEYISNQIVATSLEILNVFGKSVSMVTQSSKEGMNLKTLDVSNLQSGTYLLKLTQGNYQLVKRFIKH